MQTATTQDSDSKKLSMDSSKRAECGTNIYETFYYSTTFNMTKPYLVSLLFSTLLAL